MLFVYYRNFFFSYVSFKKLLFGGGDGIVLVDEIEISYIVYGFGGFMFM